jgi:hypothetical protein
MFSSDYSSRLFIQGSKHWKHPNNGIILKEFVIIIHFFLNHAVVVSEEQIAILILKKRFVRCIHILNSFISYNTLHAKTSFNDHVALMKLRYLNFRNIVNLEQVRSWTFQVNDLLYIISNDKRTDELERTEGNNIGLV